VQRQLGGLAERNLMADRFERRPGDRLCAEVRQFARLRPVAEALRDEEREVQRHVIHPLQRLRAGGERLDEAQVRDGRLLGGECRQRLQHVPHPLGPRLALEEADRSSGQILVEVVLLRREERVVLVGEVFVEDVARDPRRGDDFGDRHLRVSGRTGDLGRRVQDALALVARDCCCRQAVASARQRRGHVGGWHPAPARHRLWALREHRARPRAPQLALERRRVGGHPSAQIPRQQRQLV
jgi:hypothetical protein